VEVDAGHPGARLIDLRDVLRGGCLAQIPARRRLVFGRDTIHLTDLYTSTDRQHFRREGLGINRDSDIRVYS
jgi:hypothetical protein